MKKYLYTLIFLILYTVTYSQVSFNTATPNKNTLLHISEENIDGITVPKGILLPRLNQSEIDILTYIDPLVSPKVIRLTDDDNGLFVFNTTSKCYNYWQSKEQSWKTICTKTGDIDDLEGDLGVAEFDLDCSNVNIDGNYMINQPLDANLSNYLIIPVTVTKPGTYTFAATTTHGFGFVTSGLFTTKGKFTLKVPGQGTPDAEGSFPIDFTLNSTKLTCTAAVQVLGPNTIGPEIKITRKMKILTLGGHWGSFDSFAWAVDSNQGGAIIKSPLNFGNQKNSVVNYVGWEDVNIITNTNSSKSSIFKKPVTRDKIKEMLTKTATNVPYDIVIIHSYFTFDDDNNNNFYAGIFNDYLNNGGVVLMYSGSSFANSLNNSFFDLVFGAASGPHKGARSAIVNRDAVGYSFTNESDTNLKGPFGDLRKKHWLPSNQIDSNNHYGFSYSSLPANEIVILSNDGTTNNVTAFRHKTKNLVWVGDIGFFEGYGLNKDIRNGYPLSRALRNGSVYNSPFFANSLAWALITAQTTGINTK